MFRRFMVFLLSAILLLTCIFPCLAEQDDFDRLEVERYIPTEPFVTESEFIRVSAEYLPDDDLTRYTAALTGNPTFSDGAAITAQDLLFSLYVYLDPGYPQFMYAAHLPIVGLENYRLQISEERLSAAAATLSAIQEADEDHVWTESDPWTEEMQTAYRKLHDEYAAACEVEFIACAQAIVDYCAKMLETDSRGAFGRASADISGNDGLRIAYAMVQWGYATAEENLLTGKRSGTVWNLEEQEPTLEDFVNELSIAYDGDLAACWAVETTGTYTPALPDVEREFRDIYLGDVKDSISSISGIRLIDDSTLEIDLAGLNMHEAGTLFGMPILSLNVCGDANLWSPENGLYGHLFGEIPDVDSPKGPVLLDVPHDILF